MTRKTTTKNIELLNQIYKEVKCLKTWLTDFFGPDSCVIKNLLENAPYSFETFLEETLVATPYDRSRLMWLQSDCQASTQNEVLLYLIAKFRNQTSCLQNVLTLGFREPTCYSTNAQSSVHTGVDCSFPNFMVNQLKSSNWTHLLYLIGVEKMLILLGQHALFMTIKPSACIQLTGTAIYDLIPLNSQTHFKIVNICKNTSTNNSNNVDSNTGVSKVGTGSNNDKISNSCARNISNNDGNGKKTNDNVTPISNPSVNSRSDILSNNFNVENNCNFSFTSDTDIICNNVSDSTVCNNNVGTKTNVTSTNYSSTNATSLINTVSSCVAGISNSNTTDNTGVISSCITSNRNSNSNTGSNDISSDCSKSIAKGNDSNNSNISKNGSCNKSDANNMNSNGNPLDQPSSTVDGWRLLGVIADNHDGEVSKTTKKTRRGKRNRSSTISHCPLLNLKFNPYCYGETISHFSVIYCRNLSQKPFKKDRPFGRQSDGLSGITAHIFSDIFEKTFVGSSKIREVSLCCNRNHSVASRSFCAMPGRQFAACRSRYNENKVPAAVEKMTSTVSDPECPKCQLKEFLMAEVKPLLEKMVNNHRSLKILDRYCAISTENAKSLNLYTHLNKKTSHSSAPHRKVGSIDTNRVVSNKKSCHLRKAPTIRRLVCDVVSHQQVYVFLKVCVKRLVPVELFGSNHNRNLFLKHVKRFVFMGKYEKLSLGELMHGMKTSCCAWLKKIPSQSWRSRFLAQLIMWLFNEVILPLIKDSFYVTDSCHFRNRLFYYRKPIWSCVRMQAVKDLISSEMMTPIKQAYADEAIKEGSSLGISTVRFLPKGQSIRAVTNMNWKMTPKRNQPTIKKQLTALFHALNSVKDLYPSSIGCSVFGVDDIYQKWRQFLKTRTDNKDERFLYFVKVDIKKCYDSMKHDVLMEIITDALKQGSGNFILRKYGMVYLAKKRPKRKFVICAQDFDHWEVDFRKFIHSMIRKRKLHNVIITDKVEYENLEASELLSKLYSHVVRNIVKINSRYYLQQIGISQGSVLSTLLCSFYYGHMEKTMLKGKSDDLMMRLVDDYLFVTPDESRAVNFLETFLTGVSKYNCHIQHDKLFINFHYNHQKYGWLQRLKQTDMIPWCGLLINMTSLEIMKDYSRYCGISISDTVSAGLSHHPGVNLQECLLRFMQPKCQLIFVDQEINTLGTIINNVFDIFYLIACRFHTHVCRLPSNRRVAANLNFFFECIEEIADYFEQQIYYYMIKMNGTICYPLNKLENKWLCFMAFDLKLSCNCSQYHKLRNLLQMYFTQTKHLLSKKRYKLFMEVKESGVSDHFKNILD